MENLLAALGRHLFLIFGLVAVGAAVAMVSAKNAIHSVLAFLAAMLAVSCCYFTLHAEFLGVAQLMIYAGGIVVLFLFVVMLVEMTKRKEGRVFQMQAPWAVVLALAGAAGFLAVFWKTVFSPSAPEALTLRPELAQGLDVAKNNAQAVSRGLFADYLLPFEILSVILLVALVAAIVLAKAERS